MLLLPARLLTKAFVFCSCMSRTACGCVSRNKVTDLLFLSRNACEDSSFPPRPPCLPVSTPPPSLQTDFSFFRVNLSHFNPTFFLVREAKMVLSNSRRGRRRVNGTAWRLEEKSGGRKRTQVGSVPQPLSQPRLSRPLSVKVFSTKRREGSPGGKQKTEKLPNSLSITTDQSSLFGFFRSGGSTLGRSPGVLSLKTKGRRERSIILLSLFLVHQKQQSVEEKRRRTRRQREELS